MIQLGLLLSTGKAMLLSAAKHQKHQQGISVLKRRKKKEKKILATNWTAFTA